MRRYRFSECRQIRLANRQFDWKIGTLRRHRRVGLLGPLGFGLLINFDREAEVARDAWVGALCCFKVGAFDLDGFAIVANKELGGARALDK